MRRQLASRVTRVSRVASTWRALWRRCSVLWLALWLTAAPACALKPVTVDPDVDRVEITSLRDLHEYYDGRGDNLQVETAAGADGARGGEGSGGIAFFKLSNFARDAASGAYFKPCSARECATSSIPASALSAATW